MGKKKVSVRRLAREKAFQTLYGLNFWRGHNRGNLREVFDRCPTGRDEELPERAEDYGWELTAGVYENRDDLDATIGRFSQHWKVSRIARIELTILRLALYEMVYVPDVPLKVAINEAVELAKQFGDDHSGNFVNGILDAAARAVEKGDFTIKKDI